MGLSGPECCDFQGLLSVWALLSVPLVTILLLAFLMAAVFWLPRILLGQEDIQDERKLVFKHHTSSPHVKEPSPGEARGRVTPMAAGRP
jgi:hypothetical protein